jgi:hypothetical protein
VWVSYEACRHQAVITGVLLCWGIRVKLVGRLKNNPMASVGDKPWARQLAHMHWAASELLMFYGYCKFLKSRGYRECCSFVLLVAVSLFLNYLTTNKKKQMKYFTNFSRPVINGLLMCSSSLCECQFYSFIMYLFQ